MNKTEKYNPIIFYDGDCGFCNSSIQFVLNKKKRPARLSHAGGEFYFVALQSDFAKKILSEKDVVIEMDTIYFLKNGKLFDKSSAGLQICKGLKGLYPLLFGFYIIPKFMRDPFYNFIAKRRHKIRAGYCLVPLESDKKFFVETSTTLSARS